MYNMLWICVYKLFAFRIRAHFYFYCTTRFFCSSLLHVVFFCFLYSLASCCCLYNSNMYRKKENKKKTQSKAIQISFGLLFCSFPSISNLFNSVVSLAFHIMACTHVQLNGCFLFDTATRFDFHCRSVHAINTSTHIHNLAAFHFYWPFLLFFVFVECWVVLYY